MFHLDEAQLAVTALSLAKAGLMTADLRQAAAHYEQLANDLDQRAERLARATAHLRALAINAADQFWKRGHPLPARLQARLDDLGLDIPTLEARYALGDAF